MTTIFMGVIALAMIVLAGIIVTVVVLHLKGIKEIEEMISDAIEGYTNFVQSDEGLKKSFEDFTNTIRKFDKTLNNLAAKNKSKSTRTRNSHVETKN